MGAQHRLKKVWGGVLGAIGVSQDLHTSPAAIHVNQISHHFMSVAGQVSPHARTSRHSEVGVAQQSQFSSSQINSFQLTNTGREEEPVRIYEHQRELLPFMGRWKCSRRWLMGGESTKVKTKNQRSRSNREGTKRGGGRTPK